MAAARTSRGPLLLRLYVAGHAPNSMSAIKNVKTICEEHFAGAYELDIVDMLAHPQRAMADAIIVTPTLLKLAPAPAQRVIGNMSDASRVLALLGGA